MIIFNGTTTKIKIKKNIKYYCVYNSVSLTFFPGYFPLFKKKKTIRKTKELPSILISKDYQLDLVKYVIRKFH